LSTPFWQHTTRQIGATGRLQVVKRGSGILRLHRKDDDITWSKGEFSRMRYSRNPQFARPRRLAQRQPAVADRPEMGATTDEDGVDTCAKQPAAEYSADRPRTVNDVPHRCQAPRPEIRPRAGERLQATMNDGASPLPQTATSQS